MTASAPELAPVAALTISARRTRSAASRAENTFPIDTGAALFQLLQQYSVDRTPIPVSFRQLVLWLRVGERATHYIHPYPAKLLPHIAHFFLATSLLTGTEESILDPFSGSGTVPLETILSGRPALYADANPLARLISRVKTRAVEDDLIVGAGQEVQQRYLLSRARKPPNVVNVDKWFDPLVITKLARLRSAIATVDEPALRELMLVTFSAVIRKASNSDPRFSVPVRRRLGDAEPNRDVLGLFKAQLEANRQRLVALSTAPKLGRSISAGHDARALEAADLTTLPDNSVGMILTSPPYAGAQKYVRATSLSLGWLDLVPAHDLRKLEDSTIGREHFPKAAQGLLQPTGIAEADELLQEIRKTSPIRATIAATYLTEMRVALAEAVRVLKEGGYFILVIGDNTICGRPFQSSSYLREILTGLGMETVLELVDPIRSRGLMTRRAGSASVIAHETVLVLRKYNS